MAPSNPITAAMRLLQTGSWHEAELAAREALADDPNDPAAWLLLGLSIATMGEAGRAAPSMNRAAEMRPDAVHPCEDLATLQPALPRFLVSRQFAACLRLSPNDTRLRLAFAAFLLDNDWPEQALPVLAEAGDNAAKHHLAGLARAECGQFPAAIDSFQRAVALDPNAAASWSNLGMMLKIEDRFAEALEAHDKAVALDPHNPRLKVNRAVTLLRSGAWTEAWADYEARLNLAEAPAVDTSRLLPPLGRRTVLAGSTVVVLHEDGFGDSLHFSRYIPLLADRGARVLVCVPPALGRLMGSLPGVAGVVTDARRLPPHDFICPMFSLPRIFGTTVETIPPVARPALDRGILNAWARRLPADGLRVGIVWAGQARPALPGFRTLDRRRSAGLAAFEPLTSVPGVRLISLQAGPPARQPRPPGMALMDPMTDVGDFADTAAVVAGLDVVVSVDTSVVHLAGLMDKPVFMLDRYDGCWRWLSGRRDSPWYPKLTIFRQPEPGNWQAAVTEAAAALHAMALFHGVQGAPTPVLREPAYVA